VVSDFPGCVRGGRSQEQTIERAENALAQRRWAVPARPAASPATPIERIVLPKAALLAYFIVGVDPPDRRSG